MAYFIMLDNKEKNRVAVVMATYNGEKYIREQLDSLINQKNANFMIYCSDDNSNDSTLNILEEYKSKYNKIVYETNKSNRGPSSNFLNALRMISDEEYIVFCDQDDVWLPNKINNLLTFADGNLSKGIPGIAYCDAFVVNQQLDLTKTRMYGDHHHVPATIEDLLYHNGGIQGASMIINKPMANEMLHYNGYVYMHDQLATFLAIIHKNIYYLNTAMMLYRQHSNNVVGRNIDLKNKVKILYSSYLIDLRSFAFIREFYEVYHHQFPQLKNTSTKLFLQSYTSPAILALQELILGNATLHGSRAKLLIKLFIKFFCGRVISQK